MDMIQLSSYSTINVSSVFTNKKARRYFYLGAFVFGIFQVQSRNLQRY